MLWIILIIVIILVIWVVATYNNLVDKKNKVEDQWSQIDVVLKRRFDLIPNLVETVKGYAKHESETLEAVINARNSYSSAKSNDEKLKADNQLTGCLTKLFALAESYPDLKANENFNNLQKELTDTEDKIQYARQFYNDSALKYNNLCQQFPSVIVAGMFHFQKVEYFKATDEERQNVQVKF